ncbi:MAG: 2-amino-4-hydroxy-6-hydroxymethyldihydropteridine diphosphokinase [Sandaracinaceae bacterium]
MRAVVGVGSNLGSREAYLDAAAALLGDALLARSPVYETAPMGPPQPSYLNGAFLLEVDCAPEALLTWLLRIEAQLGRVRDVRWGPRTVDLDLLFLDHAPIDTERLTVPHPRLADRAFALAPMLDVAPWLASRYGSALERLGGAPALFDPGGRAQEAALAAAVNGWLGASRGHETVRVEALDAARWVREATDFPGACSVAIEPIRPAGVCGTVLLDGSSRRLPGELQRVGRQVVVIAAP